MTGKHFIVPFGNISESEKVNEEGCCYCVGFEVIPETIGQYTGLTDKNGKKIFEGDIVDGIAYACEWKGVIVWIPQIASFGLNHGHDTAWENCTILKRAARGMNDEFSAEIIGNIHDNPELLEVNS